MTLVLDILALVAQTAICFFAISSFFRVRALEKDLRRIKIILHAPMSVLMTKGTKEAIEVLRRHESHENLHKNRFDLN